MNALQIINELKKIGNGFNAYAIPVIVDRNRKVYKIELDDTDGYVIKITTKKYETENKKNGRDSGRD